MCCSGSSSSRRRKTLSFISIARKVVLCCVALARSLTIIMAGFRAVLSPTRPLSFTPTENLKQHQWNALFPQPTKTVFSGPSGCGKTEFVKHVAKGFYRETGHEIYWYYAEHQPDLHRELYNFVEFREGIIPSVDDFEYNLLRVIHPKLIIIDDSLSDRASEVLKFFGDEFEWMNRGLRIVVMVENFMKTKELKAIADKARHILLFKSPNKEEEEEQIKYMADRQYTAVSKYFCAPETTHQARFTSPYLARGLGATRITLCNCDGIVWH
jgi:hypothetical protein